MPRPLPPVPPPPPEPPSNSAEMRYYQYLKKEPDKDKIIYEDEVEKLKRKGDLSSLLFEEELSDEENAYIISGEEDKKAEKYMSKAWRRLIFTAICVVFSLGLNFIQFTLPCTPSIVKFDFSALPELAATMLVGPVAGIIVVIVKNALYFLLNSNAVASIPGKVILDTFYVLLTWFLAGALMKTGHYKKLSKRREEEEKPQRRFEGSSVVIASLISTVFTALLSVLTLKKILLPLLYHFFGEYGYTPEYIFYTYQVAFDDLCDAFPFITSIIPKLTGLNMGIILYNIPLNFLKYFICGIAAAFLYKNLDGKINKEDEK